MRTFASKLIYIYMYIYSKVFTLKLLLVIYQSGPIVCKKECTRQKYIAPEGWDEFEKKKDLPITLLHTFLYIFFPLGLKNCLKKHLGSQGSK